MNAIQHYRAQAADQRALAEATNLPNRRAMHERSAAMWEEKACAAADTAERTLVNAEARAAR